MTVYTLTAGMPAIVAENGQYLQLEAIDPTTGALVTGVIGSAWAIYGEPVPGDDDQAAGLPAGPFMLTPGPDSGIT